MLTTAPPKLLEIYEICKIMLPNCVLKFACFYREKKVVEINFLCVHKKLREKRVAPVLIREITRRVNLKGIFQAVYTAGVVLPKPVATCRYVYILFQSELLVFLFGNVVGLFFMHEQIFQPNH